MTNTDVKMLCVGCQIMSTKSGVAVLTFQTCYHKLKTMVVMYRYIKGFWDCNLQLKIFLSFCQCKTFKTIYAGTLKTFHKVLLFSGFPRTFFIDFWISFSKPSKIKCKVEKVLCRTIYKMCILIEHRLYNKTIVKRHLQRNAS